ncbi:MAG: hypothetical protein ACLU5E_01450 [Anaerovoracaceae bacterium]
MAGIYDAVYTVDGGILLADVIAKEATLDITRIVLGSGYLPDGKGMQQMTDVAVPEVELPIKRKYRAEDAAEVVIGTDFTNETVTKSFYYREFGMYAKAIYQDETESEEVLYLYGNAGDSAEWIPAHSTSTAVVKRIDMITYVGSKTNVNVEIADGINPTYEELEQELSDLKAEIEQEIDEKISEIPGLELYIGSTRPTSNNPWIWFDGIPQSEQAKAFTLNLSEGNDADVQAEVEQKEYNVNNGTLNEDNLKEGEFFVDVIN